MQKDKTIGIHLGRNDVCAAIWKNGKAEIIVNDLGKRLTPSMVAYTPHGMYVGDAAKNQLDINPKNTVIYFLDIIGLSYDDDFILQNKASWPFSVVKGDSGEILIEISYVEQRMKISPAEICSVVLRKIKSDVDAFLGTSVKNVVIAVPHYLKDVQIIATKEAATAAGFDAVEIVSEPFATSIFYASLNQYTSDNNKGKNFLVFGMSDATSTLSVVHQRGAISCVSNYSTYIQIGEKNFVNSLVNLCLQRFKSLNNVNVESNNKSWRRLVKECERAHKSLLVAPETTISIDSLMDGGDFFMTITRSRFETINSQLFANIVKAITHQDIKSRNIDVVLLTGTCTRMPKLQQILKDTFGAAKLCTNIDPDIAVAMGAAYKGGCPDGKVLVEGESQQYPESQEFKNPHSLQKKGPESQEFTNPQRNLGKAIQNERSEPPEFSNLDKMAGKSLQNALLDVAGELSNRFAKQNDEIEMATQMLKENMKILSDIGLLSSSATNLEDLGLAELVEKLNKAVKEASITHHTTKEKESQQFTQILELFEGKFSVIKEQVQHLTQLTFVASNLCIVVNDSVSYNFEGSSEIASLQKQILSLNAEARNEIHVQEHLRMLTELRVLTEKLNILRAQDDEKRQKLQMLAPVCNTVATEIHAQFVEVNKEFESFKMVEDIKLKPVHEISLFCSKLDALSVQIMNCKDKWNSVLRQVGALPVDVQKFLKESASFSLVEAAF